MHDILVQQMKEEVTRFGVDELRTPGEVDTALQSPGPVLVFVNSVCGCAGGIARPALRMALTHESRPERVATVFASTDREATARAREYFVGQPPSSPSFALLRDGRLLCMIHRSDIENKTPQAVAAMLVSVFTLYCREEPR